MRSSSTIAAAGASSARIPTTATVASSRIRPEVSHERGGGAPAAQGRRPHQAVRGAHRLPRHRLRAVAGRGARHRRRIRFGQDHAAQLHRRPSRAERGPHPVRDARRRHPRPRPGVRGRPPPQAARRYRLRAPESTRRPALRRQRRRQYRRAPDECRAAELRPHPPDRGRVAGPGRDRLAPHGREPASLLRRHAAAAADRAQPRDPPAARADGRADRQPRRLRAGALARPDPRARRRSRARRDPRDPRSRRSAAARAPAHGDAGGPHRRSRPDRPGAGRSAGTLYPAPGVVGAAVMNEAIQNVAPALEVRALSKSFTLHLQGRVHLAVLDGIDLAVRPGECVVLDGPSGAGKSTLMRTLYGNYRAEGGRILVRHADELVDLAEASPRLMLAVRRRTLGYVSQFLHVIPRVPTLAIVAEPLRALGVAAGEARDRAAALLDRLALPDRLWSLP